MLKKSLTTLLICVNILMVDKLSTNNEIFYREIC